MAGLCPAPSRPIRLADLDNATDWLMGQVGGVASSSNCGSISTMK